MHFVDNFLKWNTYFGQLKAYLPEMSRNKQQRDHCIIWKWCVWSFTHIWFVRMQIPRRKMDIWKTSTYNSSLWLEIYYMCSIQFIFKVYLSQFKIDKISTTINGLRITWEYRFLEAKQPSWHNIWIVCPTAAQTTQNAIKFSKYK